MSSLDPAVFSKDRGGRLRTDKCLRVRKGTATTDGTTFPDVFAIGDCADVDDVNHPPTAQVAERQATHLADRCVVSSHPHSARCANRSDLLPVPGLMVDWTRTLSL